MINNFFEQRFAILRGAAVYLALGGLLLFPAAAGADIEPEIQEWIDVMDGGPPMPPPPPPAEPAEGDPYPIGGPGAPAQLIRKAPNDYWDGISQLARRPGDPATSPRVISNTVIAQDVLVFSGKDASDMVWQWGQFLDHDIGLTEPGHPEEPAPILVPLCDPFFDPDCVCTDPLPDPPPANCFIPFNRSIWDPATGIDPGNVRQQLNEISAIIDGTNVYGQKPERMAELRTFEGGRLKVTSTPGGDFLPFNENGFPNAPSTSPWFFLAGDIRANETVPLSAMHTLWVREHNYLADALAASNPTLSDEEIFLRAREMVITEMQIVTFKEFLPVLLGGKAIPKYSGYDPYVNPGLFNVFSTAMFRLGHTMLSPTILRLRADGTPLYPPLALMDAFFQCVPNDPPDPPGVCKLIEEGGVAPLMKGLSEKVMQKIDSMVIDDVRNFLFGEPGEGGLDLPSLNIQRGRDHGLPDYNTVRLSFGLTPVSYFHEISSDPVVQAKLYAAYNGNVDGIDPWVGALAEDPLDESKILVGELLFTALSEQFQNIRDGDENWYQNRLSVSEQRAAEKQTLAKIIARNTPLTRKDLNANVFIVK